MGLFPQEWNSVSPDLKTSLEGSSPAHGSGPNTFGCFHAREEIHPRKVDPTLLDVFMHVKRFIQGKQSNGVMSIRNITKKEKIK
ncbi:unnamed protein product [Prunus armeniaca]|nr:hypothetical protein GBA52_014891 [Prunus armeniaca]